MQDRKQFQLIRHTEINEMSFHIHKMPAQLTHYHTDLEIDLVMNGLIMVRAGENCTAVGRGSVLVFNPYELHEIVSVEQNTRVLTLHVRPAFCERYFPALLQIRFGQNIMDTKWFGEKETDGALECPDMIRYVLLLIGKNYYLQEFGFELLCVGQLNKLIRDLILYLPYSIYRTHLPEDTENADGRMERILDFIAAHYTEHVTLEQLGEQEHLTESYLSHFIRDNLGFSFQDYVNMLRFEKAAQMLALTDKTVTEISLESGFSDSRYLKKMFEKQYHKTPAVFRREAQESWGKMVRGNTLPASQVCSREESLELIDQYLKKK